MAGRRLVDVAKLFGASRSIVQKHVALRSTQYDVYSKTSTLARAVKSQTDRITLTAAAAIALSKRFSEEAPSYARAAADKVANAQYNNIPKRGSVKRDAPTEDTVQGLQPDAQRYQSARDTAKSPQAKEELEIKQEDALRRPYPDGTIPSTGPALEQEGNIRNTPPKTESPAKDNDLGIQPEDDGLEPAQSPESTIPLPEKPTPEPAKAQEAIPEGVNTDVFHSRRVARMLGTDPFSRKEQMEPKSIGRHPLDDRPTPPNNATPHTGNNEQAQSLNTGEPMQHSTSAQKLEPIASQLAQNDQSSDHASQVCAPLLAA